MANKSDFMKIFYIYEGLKIAIMPGTRV